MAEHRFFLVGMPFVGKSYWGRLVAAHYGLTFIDLDTYISEHAGMPVPEIFATSGEQGFRELEHRYLEEVISAAGQDTIIACGGGTPCFYNNMQLMKDAGRVVYLSASPEYLEVNYRKSDENRPLMDSTLPLVHQFENMLAVREPFYTQAHHILQAADISLTTFEEILYHV